MTKLVTLNYKEPLKKVNNGFGYYGAITVSDDGSGIQCHCCGGLFASLAPHIKGKHKMTVPEYRETYELAKETALVSEDERQLRKQKMLDYIKTLTEKQKEEFIKKLRSNKRKHTHQPKLSLETKNKRGMCPDQLLDQIKKVAKKLNHVPTKSEFINETATQSFVHLIYKTYGSWSRAVEMCHFEIKTLPKAKGKHQGKEYNEDDLLEYLRIYALENDKIPTMSDFRRGNLPSYDVYVRHFGGIENARQASGIYPLLERDRSSLVTGYAAKLLNTNKNL